VTGSARRRWALALLRYALLAVVLWLVGRELVRSLGELSWQSLHFDPAWAAAAVAAMLAISVVQVGPFGLLLRAGGWRLPWGATAGIVWLSSLGKYVPGKAASVAAAMYLLARRNVPASAALGTSAVVYGLLVTVGLAAALPMLTLGPVAAQWPGAWLAVAGVLAAAVVCLHPRVLTWLIRWLWRRLGKDSGYAAPAARHYVLAAWAIMLNYAFYGLAIWFSARALGPVAPANIGWFMSAGAAAAVAGIVALFAPGGIGVREGVLLVALGHYVGRADAAIVSVALRVIQTALEAVLGAAAMAVLRRRGEAQAVECGLTPPWERR
jgi:uncharacterized membrane protein YbhN (UPF0104 family)